MWALRRASNPLRSRGFNLATRNVCVKLETPTTSKEGHTGTYKSAQKVFDGFLYSRKFYHRHVSLNVASRQLSSQADAKSKGEEDDLEDGFSELEASSLGGKLSDDESISDLESDKNDVDEDEPRNKLESSETEKKPSRKRFESPLFKAIMDAPGSSVQSALIKWVEEGNELSREDISNALLNLRNRKIFGRALQLLEWVEANKKFDYEERDYVSRLDLIAKVQGLQKAENYISTVPKSFRGEVLYRTLLSNCVPTNNVKKAEELFNRMKDLGFPITSFACNQLLVLYKRFDKKKIADVLLLMENNNVKPSPFTYKILIDTKGRSNDITGMEQIVESMKDEGVLPDIDIQISLAKYYASAGCKEKAEKILKEVEGEGIKHNRWTCQYLLPLYAELGNADDVRRIWKFCEPSAKLGECMGAIEAWGKLKEIEEAEAVLDKMEKTWKLYSKHYALLLQVYANQKMLTKGKHLVTRMASNGCPIGASALDALVKLYVEAGEVEKAYSVLQKGTQSPIYRNKQVKAMFSSYMTIMDQFAKKGDVHNSEKVLQKMRKDGYTSRIRPYQALIQAYMIAKVPAYGIVERMKADNVFPNKALASQLDQVDPFRKTAVSELLE